MRSSRRLIIKGLKPEHFKCGLGEPDRLCEDCGVLMKSGYRLVGQRVFCLDCAPYYEREYELDQLIVSHDLLRDAGVNPPRKATEEIEAELDFGERDYWD